MSLIYEFSHQVHFLDVNCFTVWVGKQWYAPDLHKQLMTTLKAVHKHRFKWINKLMVRWEAPGPPGGAQQIYFGSPQNNIPPNDISPK